ncbi:MAG: tripartite tricarboxylate transporter permease [Proteobacteria bacterium]|nr:tripartite tricarboxylate transporter permease [Pseudomonadota bacterium]
MTSAGFLLDGLWIALQPRNLLFCFIGCFWGSIVGVLPGLGPLAGMALLLPLTFSLDPTGAIIMLCGIFYGAMYGGSTTSILMRIPGEAASVVTCIDGYEMARKGRAGAALSIAAIGSFVGGVLSVIGLMLVAPRLADAMLAIGPAAEFTILLVALGISAFAATGPLLKTATMIALGLLLAMIGLDPLTATPRFTFGSLQLADGLSFAAMAIGLFGVSEILMSFGQTITERPKAPALREMLPNRRELKEAAMPTLRGSFIGFVFGIVPGVGHIVSTFASYAVEKSLSKRPEEFGQGAVAGVAGPETANNATTGAAMIPLLVLGIPAIPVTAVLLSALTIHGVQPGPLMIAQHPEIFWGLIASMLIGNLMLVVLNLPLVGLFVSMLRLPYGYLAPTILLICLIGVYSVKASSFDLGVMAAFGLLGYFLRLMKFDIAPLLLAFVLGDRLEINFRRALTISEGDYAIFLKGPAAQFAVVLAISVTIGVLFLRWRQSRGATP